MVLLFVVCGWREEDVAGVFLRTTWYILHTFFFVPGLRYPFLSWSPRMYPHLQCTVLCSKNTSVYTSSDAQLVRVFWKSHGFLFSGKRLSPFSFLNSLLFLSTSTFSHRAKNLDSCTPKLGAHVCSSCIRLLQGVYWAVWSKLTTAAIIYLRKI